MTRRSNQLALGFGLCVGVATAVGCSGSVTVHPAVRAPRAQVAPAPVLVVPSGPIPLVPVPTPLQFSELVSAGTSLAPSERALQLAGQRVRMVGFMAELELALHGAFFLTSRPVHGDEAGAGTAELPIDAVLISLPFLRERPVPHVMGAVEVVGVLDVGNRVDDDGHASNFRIQVDDPRVPTPTD